MSEDVEPTTPPVTDEGAPEGTATPWSGVPAPSAPTPPEAVSTPVAWTPAWTDPPAAALPAAAPPDAPATGWTPPAADQPATGPAWTPPAADQPATGPAWTPLAVGAGWPQAPGGTGWAQPAPPAAGAGWPPPPGPWSPGPAEPWGQPPRRRPRAASAVLMTAALVAAALFGVGVGRAVNRNRTTTTAASFQAPVAPSSGGATTLPNGSTPALGTSSVSAVEAGVVDIDTKLGYQSASAAGTGMVLTASGEILTNNHVIDGATEITATVVATGKTYTAKVIGTDVTADVALLQLKGASGLTTIPLGTSAGVAGGDAVVAIGNAGGVGGAPSVVTGTVQATGQAITASDQGGANAERLTNLIETDAPIQPGDSGGPLVNAAGKVIGMDTAASAGSRFQSAANVAFAIPIDDALSIVHQIEAGKASATVHLGLPGFLGVEVRAGAATATGTGALVSGVVSGSPAASAGMRAGDTITAVDGHPIAAATDLTGQLQSHHAGDKVAVTWIDTAGSSHTATVTLVTGPAN